APGSGLRHRSSYWPAGRQTDHGQSPPRPQGALMIGEILSSHAYPSAKRTEQTATAPPASAAEEARLAEPEPALDRYTPTGRAQQAADYRTQILAAQHKFSFGELRERIAGLLRQQGIEAGWLTRMSSEDAAAALA